MNDLLKHINIVNVYNKIIEKIDFSKWSQSCGERKMQFANKCEKIQTFVYWARVWILIGNHLVLLWTWSISNFWCEFLIWFKFLIDRFWNIFYIVNWFVMIEYQLLDYEKKFKKKFRMNLISWIRIWIENDIISNAISTALHGGLG